MGGWMDLEGIMRNKISQTEKNKYCMISYVESKKKQNSQKQRVEWWLPGGGVREMRRC